eukprot:7907697-Prorocentrum_lima.AAC.1
METVVDGSLVRCMRGWCELMHGKLHAMCMSFLEVHAQYVAFPAVRPNPRFPGLGWVFRESLEELNDGE